MSDRDMGASGQGPAPDRPGSGLPSVPPPVAGRVGVVGVCAAGKSLLVRGLCAAGLDARQVAQEHSFLPDMWQRLARPEVLVYLDASLDTVRRRRDPSFPAEYLVEQRRRLAHAREHCHVHVATDALGPPQVLAEVLARLARLGVTARARRSDASE